MANLDDLRKYRKIHMIGIGGSSMSGIAEMLNTWNFEVTGSDVSHTAITDKLIEDGIDISFNHDIFKVDHADLVIYSAAIKEDDVELKRARELGIETLERADFLGEITKAFRNTICISGTHGKSTTSGMVALCFMEAKLDPSIQIGAEITELGTNYRCGKSDYFIIEACEYVGSFLRFFPKAEIVLNIDDDHLDYFKNLDNIKNAFGNFVKLIPDDGVLVYNLDDENSENISKNTKAKIVTFGINNKKANFVAKNISFNANGCPTFDCYYNGLFFKTYTLNVPGKHNVYNALACIALCTEFGIDRNDIRTALKKYHGVKRRFEYVGEVDGASVYDDYGHHPTEIKAVSDIVNKKEKNHSWVIFQPHTYSRTQEHLDEFAEVLTNFDNIIVTDIYAAREKNVFGVSSKDIVDRIEKLNRKAYYIPDFDDIIDFLKRNVKEGDLIVTQGAGTITNLAHELVED